VVEPTEPQERTRPVDGLEIPRAHVVFPRVSSPMEKLVPMLVQGSAVAATLIGASGCVSIANAQENTTDAREALFGPIDEAGEARILARTSTIGTLVEVNAGDPGAATRVTIHGINAAPDTVEPLNARGVKRGDRVLTFAYDDRHSRLSETSAVLARELGEWMKSNPGERLIIEAHSMGGRVLLGALNELNARGELTGPVDVTLIAPPLAGYRSANGSRMLPGFIARAIGGAMPGKDMGTSSDYQKMLESLTLPSSVKTTIYVAANDTIAMPDSPTNVAIARNLGARFFRVDGAGHDDVIGRVVSGDRDGIVDLTP